MYDHHAHHDHATMPLMVVKNTFIHDFADQMHQEDDWETRSCPGEIESLPEIVDVVEHTESKTCKRVSWADEFEDNDEPESDEGRSVPDLSEDRRGPQSDEPQVETWSS